MCRVVDTVLVDQEAVYAPRQGNDRLLLGLKGSLNEYELDLLRQRSPVKSLATAPPISRAIATPLGLDRAPRDGVCGCWEAVGKWPAGATVESSGVGRPLIHSGQRGRGVARSVSVLEAPAGVAGFDDVAVVRQAVEHGSRHLGVAEHLGMPQRLTDESLRYG